MFFETAMDHGSSERQVITVPSPPSCRRGSNCRGAHLEPVQDLKQPLLAEALRPLHFVVIEVLRRTVPNKPRHAASLRVWAGPVVSQHAGASTAPVKQCSTAPSSMATGRCMLCCMLSVLIEMADYLVSQYWAALQRTSKPASRASWLRSFTISQNFSTTYGPTDRSACGHQQSNEKGSRILTV